MKLQHVPRGTPSPTFLVHFFGQGLQDSRYVVVRYRSKVNGDICRAHAGGKTRTSRPVVLSLRAVKGLRPESDEIIICSSLDRTNSGVQYWGSLAAGLFSDRLNAFRTK